MDEKMNEKFGAALAELFQEQGQINFAFSPLEAWALLTQLQVASRHPANTGVMSAIAFQVAKEIQAKVAGTELLSELAEMGWHKRFDLPTSDTEYWAEVAHELWSMWMRWMFEHGRTDHLSTYWMMDKDKEHRWRRQMRTPYSQLSEAEKQSDRDAMAEARRNIEKRHERMRRRKD